MRKSILFIFILCTALGFSQNLQEKHQRAKISYNQSEDLIKLESFGIPIDHGVHKKGVFIISDFSISEIQTAKNAIKDEK